MVILPPVSSVEQDQVFIEGENIYDYLHPDDIRFGKDQFSAFLASLVPEKHLEHRIRASDGRYLVLESSFHNLVHDKAINGLLLTARDITAKREADALMRKLQLVIEQSPNSVVITNKDGIIEYVNPQFEKVTGFSSAEALGQNPRILGSGLTPPETYKEMWDNLAQGKIWQGEFANRKKNGEIYYENVIIAPLKDEHDTITHYVALKENITELKKARELAEASNKAKSQFLSRMSHELRTPLNAINGFSKLLIDSRNNPLTPRQMEQALQINTAGHYLLALINEILDLARIESGKLALTIENIQPIECITSCLALVESQAINNKVSIHVDDSVQKLPPLKADQTRLKQIMLNLLSNAVKYNRPGGTVTVTAAVENQMATIQVIDTGIGIAPEKQQDIFVPFTRLGQDNTPIEGTGIGMTITKQLIELLHGAIGFTSVPGVGSTFRITLPLAGREDMTEKVSTPRSEQDKTASPEATMLYIEENALDIAHMRKLLSQWPLVSLVIRKTLEKGMQAVEMLHPDLIVININLTGANGTDFLLSLRQKSKAHHIPVIATGSGPSPDTVKYRELGYDHYIAQPLDEQKLNDILLSTRKEQDHA
jgi:PAS domain S-box-containing protein